MIGSFLVPENQFMVEVYSLVFQHCDFNEFVLSALVWMIPVVTRMSKWDHARNQIPSERWKDAQDIELYHITITVPSMDILVATTWNG